MGYYTDYTITADIELDATLFENITNYCMDDLNDVKWYDYEIHMKQFSQHYPEQLITVTGNGEESDDMWIAYFKNGKVQHCQAEIAFPPFDETKLK